VKPRRPVDLSPLALVRAGIVGALAFDPVAAAARSWTLRADDSDEEGGGADLCVERVGSVAVVRIYGPLQQRAVQHLCGVTDGYDAIEARFCAALDDSNVGAVVMAIDSPGGDVAGLLGACARMRAAADRAGKPVFAVADEWATSAAFALACVADAGRVFAPTGGRVAAIGAVRLVANMAGALALEGTEVRIFRSGDRKMRPSGIEPIDDTTASIVQAEVDAAAERFAAWVASRRGSTPQAWLALDGACLVGEAARAAGLIDGVETAHRVIQMAGESTALVATAGALGLPPTATHQEIESRAAELRALAGELSAVKSALAAKDAELVAIRAADERAKLETARVSARATFAAEVQALQVAARVSPASAASVLAHYDAHGEASARSTLALVTSDVPQVLTVAGAKPGAVPVPVGSATALTPAQLEHAKALGATPEAYAAAVLPGEKAS